jgi:hypothetical protein
MQPLTLNDSARRLVLNLQTPAPPPTSGHVNSKQTVHVADLGASFYFAYEQLRNVAEYREHHLLLRSAIERYLWRYVKPGRLEPFAVDLIIELTQAGYLKNDSVPVAIAEAIDASMADLSKLSVEIIESKQAGPSATTEWLFQYASVKIETLINPDHRTPAIMQFAYEHYLTALDKAAIMEPQVDDQHFRIALYCAIQTTIFKSDLATMRYYCLLTSLGPIEHQPPGSVAAVNYLIDDLAADRITSRISRLLNRYGPPLRILRSLVYDGSSAANTLQNRGATLSKVKLLCAAEYEQIHAQLSQRIIKTILFVLVTKTIVGLAIEVPYDLAVHGAIAWQPLLINILFPPLYMATISTRIRIPSSHNTEAVAALVDRILYEGAGAPVAYRPRRRRLSQGLRMAFNIVYALGFIGSLALMVFILRELGFNVVGGIIFFLFFSAVSFLGLRLRRSASELQLLDEQEGFLSAFIDFLSAPFVAAGRWLSERYAQANIITLILDLAIEIPFKTFIRLARQWTRFLRDKQDEL